MKTIVVIGCGKAKVNHPAPIVDLYTGSLYRARLELARAMGGPHWILSAEFGCCRPDTPAEPYDQRLCEKLRVWFEGSCFRNVIDARNPAEYRLDQHDRLVVLASHDYARGWSDRIEKLGFTVIRPLSGLGLGQQIKRCYELAAELRSVRQLELAL